jgi:hypothetical protein
MEGYDVISNDDHKVGQVVGTENGYVIVESGMMRKHKYAIPMDMTRTEPGEEVVRLSVSKQLVEEGPTVDDGDWQSVEDYYGRSAEQEAQAAADIPPADQSRAEMRESLSGPEKELSQPRKGAVGIHQDEWGSKE